MTNLHEMRIIVNTTKIRELISQLATSRHSYKIVTRKRMWILIKKMIHM